MKRKNFKKLVPLFLILFALSIAVESKVTLEKIRSYDFGDEIIKKVIFSDIDNDDLKEMIILLLERGSYSIKYKIVALEADGNVKWERKYRNKVYDFLVDDINNDGEKEIVVSYGSIREFVARGHIDILNSEGKLIKRYPKNSLGFEFVLEKMFPIDLDYNSYKEILGYSRKGVYAIKDTYASILWKRGFPGGVYDLIPESRIMGKRSIIVEGFGKIYFLEYDGSILDEVDLSYPIAFLVVTSQNYADIVANFTEMESLNENIANFLNKTNEDAAKLLSASLEEQRSIMKLDIIGTYEMLPIIHEELLLKTNIGSFVIYSPYGTLFYVGTSNPAPLDLIPVDYDKDGYYEVLACLEHGYYLIDLGLKSKSELLKIEDIYHDLTENTILKCFSGDYDGDGLQEVYFTTDNSLIFIENISERDNLINEIVMQKNWYSNKGDVRLENIDDDKLKELVVVKETSIELFKFKEEMGEIPTSSIPITTTQINASATLTKTSTTSTIATTSRSQDFKLESEPYLFVFIFIIFIILALLIVFRRIKPETKKIERKEKVVKEKELPSIEREEVEEDEEFYRIFLMEESVEEIKKTIKEIGICNYDLLIKLEREGKNRKELIEWLEKQKKEKE